MYARIRKGDVYTRTLVIPEGYNIFDIAQAVEAAGLGSRAEFLAAEQKHTELIAAVEPGGDFAGGLFVSGYVSVQPACDAAVDVERDGEAVWADERGAGFDAERMWRGW